MRLQRTFTGYFLFTEISSLLRWNREFNASLWANTWEYFVKTGKYWGKANWALICKRTLDINRFLIFLGYKSFWSITRPKEFKMLDCFFSKVLFCFHHGAFHEDRDLGKMSFRWQGSFTTWLELFCIHLVPSWTCVCTIRM